MASGGVGFTVPFAACGHWRAGPSATIIIVMNESLQQHLECLARDECYRVDAVLKEGRLERTGFPNRCAMWWPRRRRSTLQIGSGRWERCARRSCTRSGAPSIFEGGISYCWYGLCAGAGDIPRGDLSFEAGCAHNPGYQPGLRLDDALRSGSAGHAADFDLAGVTPGAAEPALSSAAPGASMLRDAEERDSRLLRMAQKPLRWLWGLVRHRAPLAFGRWRGVDILLAAWGAVMAFACVASGMNPQGDMARLSAVACAVSYVCVWLVMGCPIPLLVDTRPIEKLFPLFEWPSLKQRVIAVAGMAGVAFAVLTLIGILFLRES